MKKNIKIICSLVLLMMLVITNSNVTFAQESNELRAVKVNDVVIGNTGKKETVIVVFPNGSYVTSTACSKIKSKGNSSCSHPGYVAYGTIYKQKESYNKTNATYCYKIRNVQKAKCVRCGKTADFKFYGQWQKVKHSYPFLKKTCKECGYKK